MRPSPTAHACAQARLYRKASDRSSQNLIAKHQPSKGPGIRFYNRIAAETHALLNGAPLTEMQDDDGRTYWLLPASYHTRKRNARQATPALAPSNTHVEVADVYVLHFSGRYNEQR